MIDGKFASHYLLAAVRAVIHGVPGNVNHHHLGRMTRNGMKAYGLISIGLVWLGGLE